MSWFNIFGSDDYEVACQRCGLEMKINREEVKDRAYQCLDCGKWNRVPDHIQEEYKRGRTEEVKEEERKEQTPLDLADVFTPEHELQLEKLSRLTEECRERIRRLRSQP